MSVQTDISERSRTSQYTIPVSEVPSFIFKDRSLSILEVMVEYLHDVKKYSFHEIALALNRDDRTIWTVYHRVKQKRNHGRKSTS